MALNSCQHTFDALFATLFRANSITAAAYESAWSVWDSYSLGWRHWFHLWSERQRQSHSPPSLLTHGGIQAPFDSRPWARSDPLAQQTCVAAWACTPEHLDRERTSEATGQAPEVEAHIWAGISANRERERESIFKSRVLERKVSMNTTWHLPQNMQGVCLCKEVPEETFA